MLTVSEDDLDFADEYDPMHEVYYQSEPFTGLAKTASESTEYRNGKAHGRYEMWFANGSLSAEGTYANGECLEMQSWYEDGSLRESYQDARIETKKWDRDGILAYHAATDDTGLYQSRWYYKNGVVIQHYTARQGTDYFTSDGRLAMRVTYGPVKNSVKYDDDALKSGYLAMLTNDYLEEYLEVGTYRTNADYYFYGWVWQMLKKVRPTALAILNHLSKEPSDTASQILKNIKTINLDTFEPSMGYDIVD